MIAEGQTFANKRIILDGCSFTNCRFEKCTIVYSGALGMELVNPDFVDCRWELAGAARETLHFLASIYEAGGQDLIEATFETIRGNKPKGQALN